MTFKEEAQGVGSEQALLTPCLVWLVAQMQTGEAFNPVNPPRRENSGQSKKKPKNKQNI